MEIVDGGDDAANDELVIFDGDIAVFGEKGAIAMRHHFQFNSPRLEGLGAKLPQHSGQRRPKPPPQFLFQIAQVRDPAGTPDSGIDFGMFAITDTRWEKTFAPLLHKIQKPPPHLRPEPIVNKAVWRRF